MPYALFGRTIRIWYTNTFKILEIKFLSILYCFRNSEYGKRYGTLGNVLPCIACVKEYSKNMATPKIGSCLVCNCQDMAPVTKISSQN